MQIGLVHADNELDAAAPHLDPWRCSMRCLPTLTCTVPDYVTMSYWYYTHAPIDVSCTHTRNVLTDSCNCPNALCDACDHFRENDVAVVEDRISCCFRHLRQFFVSPPADGKFMGQVRTVS